MSVTDKFVDSFEDKKDSLKWHLKFNSITNALYIPYWWIMRRERGNDFPYYFPDEGKFVEKTADRFTEFLDDAINAHETERNRDGDYRKTMVERFKWVLTNFHYYANDTMANLYFNRQLPNRDYQRVKQTYNQICLAFLAYNTLSGVCLIALNNYAFKTRKVSLPLVALASITTMGSMMVNYKLSYHLADRLFGVSVRRMGYGEEVHRYNTHFNRNVDFSFY